MYSVSWSWREESWSRLGVLISRILVSERRLLIQALMYRPLEQMSGPRGGQGQTVELECRIYGKSLVHGSEERESLVVPWCGRAVCFSHGQRR